MRSVADCSTCTNKFSATSWVMIMTVSENGGYLRQWGPRRWSPPLTGSFWNVWSYKCEVMDIWHSDATFHAICEAVQLISRFLKLLYTGAVSIVLRRTLTGQPSNCSSVSGSGNKMLSFLHGPTASNSSAGMGALPQGYNDRHFHDLSNWRKSGVLPPLPRIHYGFTACRGDKLMWPYIQTVWQRYVLGSAHVELWTVHRADGGEQRKSILKLAWKK